MLYNNNNGLEETIFIKVKVFQNKGGKKYV